MPATTSSTGPTVCATSKRWSTIPSCGPKRQGFATGPAAFVPSSNGTRSPRIGTSCASKSPNRSPNYPTGYPKNCSAAIPARPSSRSIATQCHRNTPRNLAATTNSSGRESDNIPRSQALLGNATSEGPLHESSRSQCEREKCSVALVIAGTCQTHAKQSFERLRSQAELGDEGTFPTRQGTQRIMPTDSVANPRIRFARQIRN